MRERKKERERERERERNSKTHKKEEKKRKRERKREKLTYHPLLHPSPYLLSPLPLPAVKWSGEKKELEGKDIPFTLLFSLSLFSPQSPFDFPSFPLVSSRFSSSVLRIPTLVLCFPSQHIDPAALKKHKYKWGERGKGWGEERR